MTDQHPDWEAASTELRNAERDLMLQRERVAEMRRALHLVGLTRQGRGDWFPALEY